MPNRPTPSFDWPVLLKKCDDESKSHPIAFVPRWRFPKNPYFLTLHFGRADDLEVVLPLELIPVKVGEDDRFTLLDVNDFRRSAEQFDGSADMGSMSADSWVDHMAQDLFEGINGQLSGTDHKCWAIALRRVTSEEGASKKTYYSDNFYPRRPQETT